METIAPGGAIGVPELRNTCWLYRLMIYEGMHCIGLDPASDHCCRSGVKEVLCFSRRETQRYAIATFLASNQAAYITGQSIACDGGYLRGL